MAFGLRNGTATFQHDLDIILSGVPWGIYLVYLGEIVLFSKNTKDFIEHVEHILPLLSNEGVKVRLKKCFFFQQTVAYLGHVIFRGRLVVPQDAKTTQYIR